MKPRIGVTSSARGGWRSFLMHRLALWRAGAKAVRLVAGRGTPTEDLDGFIIGGGDDIGAEFYGGDMLPDVRIDPVRDQLEFDLLKEILPTDKPILGICRGAQAINIALGGTLHTDIHEVYEEAPKMRTVLPKKQVLVLEGSRLDAILKCSPCKVNALHHQSIDKLGDGLKVVGRDQVGIVQAVEGETNRFLVGVQWHPELLFYAKAQQRLFRALVESAKAFALGEVVFASGRASVELSEGKGA
ncbi:putative glutamine amidotransferase [Methyloligella halotolerans]|uniref:Putative glutamine amidotransferase n=1 Tax=Methyloligella halotolerans TaxID=1177755 RepID=A0A1E2S1G5_9HYPH|nr:gamma-glutamyl-gamma-aminobutyrate hydrolase family protein [Methyloligella halotolerans]ODA68240.1 putative glutamine amidotransferase [Methyloligella halotolerans]